MEENSDDRRLSSGMIYLYIGITSLCLYNTADNPFSQDGILYNMNIFQLCNTQIIYTIHKFQLTSHPGFGMMNMLGSVHAG